MNVKKKLKGRGIIELNRNIQPSSSFGVNSELALSRVIVIMAPGREKCRCPHESTKFSLL